MSENEYPTEEQLRKIEGWDLLNDSLKGFLEEIEACWWTPEFGYHLEKSKENKDFYVLRLSTGGWSGNEDIIESLRKNQWFWTLYWESSRRGGHYTFEIPAEKIEDGK